MDFSIQVNCAFIHCLVHTGRTSAKKQANETRDNTLSIQPVNPEFALPTTAQELLSLCVSHSIANH